MEQSKTLRMTFLNEAGKKKNLLVAEAADDLTADQVKAAMEKIQAANVFADKEGACYKTIDSAAYIERTVHTLFGDAAAAAAADK